MAANLLFIVTFVCLFGGGMLGMRLRMMLPEGYLNDDSRKLLDTGLGVIGTIGGLVLGLLVGSAFGSYNQQRSSLVQLSANIVVLDRVLAHYGPDATPARAQLRTAVSRIIDQMWPAHGSPLAIQPSSKNEVIYDTIDDLNPKDASQTQRKATALGLVLAIAQTRWLMYSQLAMGVAVPLLAVLIFWFTITFIGFGIFTRPNPTVIIAVFLSAVAVSGAVFILQEMYTPFQGPMQISSAPLRSALANLGK